MHFLYIYLQNHRLQVRAWHFSAPVLNSWPERFSIWLLLKGCRLSISSFSNAMMKLCNCTHDIITSGILCSILMSKDFRRWNFPFSKPNAHSIALLAELWRRLNFLSFSVKFPVSLKGVRRDKERGYAESPKTCISTFNFSISAMIGLLRKTLASWTDPGHPAKASIKIICSLQIHWSTIELKPFLLIKLDLSLDFPLIGIWQPSMHLMPGMQNFSERPDKLTKKCDEVIPLREQSDQPLHDRIHRCSKAKLSTTLLFPPMLYGTPNGDQLF